MFVMLVFVVVTDPPPTATGLVGVVGYVGVFGVYEVPLQPIQLGTLLEYEIGRYDEPPPTLYPPPVEYPPQLVQLGVEKPP